MGSRMGYLFVQMNYSVQCTLAIFRNRMTVTCLKIASIDAFCLTLVFESCG